MTGRQYAELEPSLPRISLICRYSLPTWSAIAGSITMGTLDILRVFLDYGLDPTLGDSSGENAVATALLLGLCACVSQFSREGGE